jgi:hypothetical protein
VVCLQHLHSIFIITLMTTASRTKESLDTTEVLSLLFPTITILPLLRQSTTIRLQSTILSQPGQSTIILLHLLLSTTILLQSTISRLPDLTLLLPILLTRA